MYVTKIYMTYLLIAFMGWLTKEEFEKTFKEIHNILSNNEIRCSCGNVFKTPNLRHTYDQYDNTYWIFANCPNCSYDLNYQKILREYKGNTDVFFS
jgi:hypothetical protein